MRHSDLVHKIREAVDLAEFLAPYTALRQVGVSAQFMGRCPLHDDSKPSFSVNNALGVWKCHGCGRGGNIFTFLKEKEGWEFAEAAAFLADRYGIAWERRADVPRGADLRAIHEMATAFFQRILLQEPEGEAARRYCEQRLLSRATCEHFRLGATPGQGNGLVRYLSGQGVSRQALLDSGLAQESDRPGHDLYDRFRRRLMIPVADAIGRTIAFAGRALTDDGPKYLNSPTTSLFKKGEHLFAWSQASSSIRHKGQVLMVEGHLDVIQCHQAGFTNTVGTMGTALAEAQMAHLQKVGRVTLIPDHDREGIRATDRQTLQLIEHGVHVRVANLRVDAPTVKDADEYLRVKGAEAFALRLEQAMPGVIFMARLRIGALPSEPFERLQALKGLGPLLLLCETRPERMEVVRAIQERAGLDPGAVSELLAPWCNQAVSQGAVRPQERPQQGSPGQREIVRLMAQDPDCRALAAEYLDLALIDDPILRQLAALLIESDCPESPADLPDWAPLNIQSPCHALLLSLLTEVGEPVTLERLKRLLIPFRARRLRQRQHALRGDISVAEEQGDEETIEDLLNESAALGRLLAQLEARHWPEG